MKSTDKIEELQKDIISLEKKSVDLRNRIDSLEREDEMYQELISIKRRQIDAYKIFKGTEK